MKAISLYQPHATLVALREKRIETRSWGTPYRGWLAIHATRHSPAWSLDLCITRPFSRVLARHNLPDMPGGVVVALARLSTSIRLVDAATVRDVLLLSGAEHEEAFGNYQFGRHAWVLADIVALPTPIAARGRQQLWDWDAPPQVLAMIEELGHGR